MPMISMQRPIWVWTYLQCETPTPGRPNVPPLSVWPEVHTYCFTNEADALAHPKAMGWKTPHSYKLSKSYLQE